MSINIHPTSLVGALRAVLPFASSDKFVPILNAVHVTLERHEDGRASILFEATDRFTLGRDRIRLFEDAATLTDEDTLDIVLSVADVKRIITTYKGVGAKFAGWTVTLTQEDSRLQLRDLDGNGMTVLAVEGEYPPLARLVKPHEDSADTWGVGFNPDMLARFAHKNLAHDHREKSLPIRTTFYGDNKPMRVDFSDHFTGLIMPVRGVENVTGADVPVSKPAATSNVA
jgi:hypothetical protein